MPGVPDDEKLLGSESLKKQLAREKKKGSQPFDLTALQSFKKKGPFFAVEGHIKGTGRGYRKSQ
jgi:hypothetical protein